MAKSGRKRKKAEKSKTKLRQSIKLPKGLNETQTEISARKITVLNQLKNRDELAAGDHDEGSSGVSKVTKRKIGIKDLMHKVNRNRNPFPFPPKNEFSVKSIIDFMGKKLKTLLLFFRFAVMEYLLN